MQSVGDVLGFLKTDAYVRLTNKRSEIGSAVYTVEELLGRNSRLFSTPVPDGGISIREERMGLVAASDSVIRKKVPNESDFITFINIETR